MCNQDMKNFFSSPIHFIFFLLRKKGSKKYFASMFMQVCVAALPLFCNCKQLREKKSSFASYIELYLAHI